MSKTVKNISGQRLAIPDIGVVEADATVSVPDTFNNPNFEVAKVGKPAETEEVEVSDAPKKRGDKKE